MRRNTVFIGVAIAAFQVNGPLAVGHPIDAPTARNSSNHVATKIGDVGGGEIAAPPPIYKGNAVTVNERLGAKLPLDAIFRTVDGSPVTLGQVLAPAGNTMPTILTFNYSNCPMLCNLQLNGLQAALPGLAEKVQGMQFRANAQFRIVTIDLEPSEPPARAAAMRERYLAKLPEPQRAAVRAGWTFLIAAVPGDASQIRRVANAAGFSYTYVPERAEWAHPAAVIFLSTAGIVTRYVYGIEFDTAVLRESLVKAGINEPSTAVGFMNRCYHYDPDASSHARAGVLALRIGAAGFLVVFLSALALLHVARGRKNPERGPGKPVRNSAANASAFSDAHYSQVEMKS